VGGKLDSSMFWYDFIYEGEREGQWTPWLTFALVVPTVDSIRLTHTFSTLLLKDEHVIVAGETGTGKSVYLSLWLQKDALESIIPLSINFSAQTHVNQLQDLLNSKFEKRRHGVYGPPAGEKNVIFIDDLNTPKKEYYGAQPPIELSRQWMDYNGWTPDHQHPNHKEDRRM
ncbi:unnamed protein product, partial [Durusdinium trenchii]